MSLVGMGTVYSAEKTMVKPRSQLIPDYICELKPMLSRRVLHCRRYSIRCQVLFLRSHVYELEMTGLSVGVWGMEAANATCSHQSARYKQN